MFFLLLLIFPFLEFYVLIQVGKELGFFSTLGLLIVSAWFGYLLIRTRGLVLLYQLQSGLLQGQTPQKDVVRGVLVLIAGLLFIIPGFISDAIALVFLMPITRDLVAVTLLWWLKGRVKKGSVKFYSSTSFGGFPKEGSFRDQNNQNPFGIPQDSNIRDVKPIDETHKTELPSSNKHENN